MAGVYFKKIIVYMYAKKLANKMKKSLSQFALKMHIHNSKPRFFPSNPSLMKTWRKHDPDFHTVIFTYLKHVISSFMDGIYRPRSSHDLRDKLLNDHHQSSRIIIKDLVEMHILTLSGKDLYLFPTCKWGTWSRPKFRLLYLLH